MNKPVLSPRAPATPTAVDRGGIVVFLGNQERRGEWTLPRHFRVVAVLGNCEVDLRHARIQPGESVIEVVAFCANVEVLAPPGLRIECDGGAFLGSYSVVRRDADDEDDDDDDDVATPPEAASDGETIVRLIGHAVLASVEGVIHRSAIDADRWLRDGHG